MSYRDRRTARAERLRGWAAKRETKSAAALSTARASIAGIPPGQPILVGHYSERRHRAALDRHDSNMRRGLEHRDKAASMNSRADNIEAAAERAIYSDDADALEQLEKRIAGLEAQRDRIKVVNAAVRKHGLEALCKAGAPFTLTADEARELLHLMQLTPFHQVDKKGFPTYALSNLSGNITRNRKRLEELRETAAARARVHAALEAERQAEAADVDDEPSTCVDCRAVECNCYDGRM